MVKQPLPIVIAVVLAFLVLSVFLYDRLGFSGEDADTVVRVYFADNISPAHQKIIDMFNAQYRGRIEVIPVNLPFNKFSTNERKELLARSLRNKSDRLDIFAVDLIWVPRFSRWCEPLDDRITPEERGQILPQAEESCIFDGKLMAVPIYIDVGMLYYRRDLLQRARGGDQIIAKVDESIRWDDLIAYGMAHHQPGRPFYLFQGNDFEGLTCNFFELIAGQDPGYFKNLPLKLDTPEAKRALTMLVDFVHRYRFTPQAVTDFDENRSYNYALDSNAIFVRGWPNFIENYRLSYANQSKLDNLQRAPLPHFEGQKATSVFGGWDLMISRYSTRKKEATEFARFFQREDMQKLLFEVGGFIPTSLAVYSDTAFIARHPVLKQYAQLVKNGFHRPALVEYTKMSDIVSRTVHRALRGEISVDRALQEMNDETRRAGAIY